MTRWIRMCRAGVLAVGLCAGGAGCSGVQLSAAYSRQLDETAALSRGLADAAAVGNLDANQMVKALDYNARAWQAFQDARDGRVTELPVPTLGPGASTTPRPSDDWPGGSAALTVPGLREDEYR